MRSTMRINTQTLSFKSILRPTLKSVSQSETKFSVYLVMCCLPIFGACAGIQKTSEKDSLVGLKVAQVASPVELKIRGDVGQKETTTYFSKVKESELEDGQLLKAREEESLFRVESLLTKVSKDSDQFHFVQKTVEKSGPSQLHDFALPELGEELEVVLNSQAKVQKAGTFPSNSIFFIPPVALPSGPVSKGDTWVLNHSWVSLKNAVPLQMEIVTILKDFYICKESDVCADLEVSGQVSMPVTVQEKLKFTSEIKGRLLLSTKTGSILWSQIRSQENLIIENNQILSESCLVSSLSDVLKGGIKDNKCETNYEDKIVIPELSL